jgi:D-lyxose ketol-isomerase
MTSATNRGLNRREMMAAAAAATGMALTGPLHAAEAAGSAGPAVKTYTNADFYDAAGRFLPEKAKAAYFDMLRRFAYPVSDTLKKGIWTLDFALGDFCNVGMAGIFWLNRQDYGYFGHEIYLLPGQMIPEHRHMATDKGPAKMESWQPRHGMIYTFGEGQPTPAYFAKIPASQREIVTSRHCQPLEGDEVADLNRREAWHFMVAGQEGAVVTEYGTFHDMAGLRFSNPKAKL